MKKVKATANFEMASRGYRLGLINAKRITHATPEISDYDDYAGLIHWQANTKNAFFELTTDIENGRITSLYICTDDDIVLDIPYIENKKIA